MARPQTGEDCTAAQWQSHSWGSSRTRVAAPGELGSGVQTPHSREQRSCRLPFQTCLLHRLIRPQEQPANAVYNPTREVCRWRNPAWDRRTDAASALRSPPGEKVHVDEAIWSSPEDKAPEGLSITLHSWMGSAIHIIGVSYWLQTDLTVGELYPCLAPSSMLQLGTDSRVGSSSRLASGLWTCPFFSITWQHAWQ